MSTARTSVHNPLAVLTGLDFEGDEDLDSLLLLCPMDHRAREI